MKPFERLHAVALPLPQANFDTDQILPARYIQKPRDNDFGEFLFRDLRYGKDGAENPDFPLNQPAYRHARIVVAGRNFACGSSREHAVWALSDYGFRAVIAPSFGDIFASNALKNGLLPIVLPAAEVEAMLGECVARPGSIVDVDLETQRVVAPGGAVHSFEIDAFSRHCLLGGLDELDYTLALLPQVLAFERALDEDARRDAAR